MSYYADDTVTVHHGDCLDVLATLPDASVDAVCTDPPYGLEFMGKEWDKFKTGRGERYAAGGSLDVEAMAAQSGKGGAGPSYVNRPAKRCALCGKQAWSGSPCKCPEPEWIMDNSPLHSFQAWCELWAVECLRVLKPGGHLLAFGGTRTSHRLACAIEDAGFEIRDSIAWLYGSGFPKSLDVSKAIDKAAGAEREVTGQASNSRNRPITAAWERSLSSTQGPSQVVPGLVVDVTAPATDAARTWQGWGTSLKPAHEPVVVARKPLAGTVAGNVQAHGTGALNVDGCRVGGEGGNRRDATATTEPRGADMGAYAAPASLVAGLGRWPANVVLDESQAARLDQQSGELAHNPPAMWRTAGDGTDGDGTYAAGVGKREADTERSGFGDRGGASRFFYTAKADARERVRSDAPCEIHGIRRCTICPPAPAVAHPTVKPLALMRWLVRLVTPPGGIVLEPFAGSGTTVEACILEGLRCVAIEREADYLPLIVQRIHRRRDPVAAVLATGEDGGLFDLLGEDDDGPAKPAGGRWPPNVVMDKWQAAELDKQSGERPSGAGVKSTQRQDGNDVYGKGLGYSDGPDVGGDSGGASRFFPVFDEDDEEPA